MGLRPAQGAGLRAQSSGRRAQGAELRADLEVVPDSYEAAIEAGTVVLEGIFTRTGGW
jgi:hypothetical protein